MHELVLEADPDGPSKVPRERRSGGESILLAVCAGALVESCEPRPHAPLVYQNVVDEGPLVGDLGVLVATLRVIDVRVDAALLKDGSANECGPKGGVDTSNMSLKYSGSVCGSLKYRERKISRNAGICPR